MTNQKKLFVLAGIDSYVRLLTVRFIVPYLLHYPVIYNKRQARCTALSVWNVVKDHRCLNGRAIVIASRKRVQR